MLPTELKPELFRGYPPQAQKIVTDHLQTLQRLPLSFLPSFLREMRSYDYRFPQEREALEQELAALNSLSDAQLDEWMAGFARIMLSEKLERLDWVNAPGQFIEQLSAYLWTTGQLDAFRAAASAYAERLRKTVPPKAPTISRLGISVIGQGVTSYDGPLFRKLRPYGTHFTHVDPQNGLNLLLEFVSNRAKAHPVEYGHWYIDGGKEENHASAVTCVSFEEMAPMRTKLLGKIQAEVSRPSAGPEELRTLMARMRPEDLGVDSSTEPVLSRFRTKLLTEGSGTQIFSTTFAQWAAREALRRAQPLTLMVRFAPRQRQKPMNELLSASTTPPQLDFLGSLIDGDMGAYYNWLNQQRLPGAKESLFLAWFEGHKSAVVISPSLPRGTQSDSVADMSRLLSWMS
jgi:hypothetical protein